MAGCVVRPYIGSEWHCLLGIFEIKVKKKHLPSIEMGTTIPWKHPGLKIKESNQTETIMYLEGCATYLRQQKVIIINYRVTKRSMCQITLKIPSVSEFTYRLALLAF